MEATVSCFTTAAESEGVIPEVRPLSSEGKKQEKANTDFQPTLIIYTVTDSVDRVNVIILSELLTFLYSTICQVLF